MSGSDTNEVLRECLAQRPKTSDIKPASPSDDIQQFFDSQVSTVRKFSLVTIARIKLKIAQIVREGEIIQTEKSTAAKNIKYIYLDQRATAEQPAKQIIEQQKDRMEHE